MQENSDATDNHGFSDTLTNNQPTMENSISKVENSAKNMGDNSTENDTKSAVNEFLDVTCGIGQFHPSFIQRCGNITCYSVSYGFTVLLTNALGVYISSQITTLERQFDLSSSQSGFILSCNDIGFILTVLFVSHFGIRYHIPRLLALFTTIYGISGIATSFLRLLSDHDMPSVLETRPRNENKSNIILCIQNRTTSGKCGTNQDDGKLTSVLNVELVFVLLCIFMGIQGFGKAPRSSLGTYYIDNNVADKTRTGFYLGISTTMGLFGPFLAITLGGLFGKIPVDLKETNIDPTDPRWIGAWWIGFLLFGAASIGVALPMILFPKQMIKSNKEESHEKSIRTETCSDVLKDIPKSLLRITRRPVYTMTVIALGIYLFAVLGGFSFGPKYIENQFNIPTWKANVILGAEKLVTGTLGTFIGGYITKRFKLNRHGCLKMVTIIMFINTLLTSLNFIFGCQNRHIYKENKASPSCSCDGVDFLAVCDTVQRTFYSPCHAGCSNQTSPSIYSNCSEVNMGSVTTGLCNTNCPYLIPYIAVQVINTFIGTLSIIPVYLIVLRTTIDKDRSIAFGLQSFVYALLVFIPSPIVFGQIFDSVCLFWKTSCGPKGACAMYDIEQMRYRLTSLEVGAKFVVWILYIVIFYIGKKEDEKTGDSKKSIELNVL